MGQWAFELFEFLKLTVNCPINFDQISQNCKVSEVSLMLGASFLFVDFHKTAPFVLTGSVDMTIKVWECR